MTCIACQGVDIRWRCESAAPRGMTCRAQQLHRHACSRVKLAHVCAHAAAALLAVLRAAAAARLRARHARRYLGRQRQVGGERWDGAAQPLLNLLEQGGLIVPGRLPALLVGARVGGVGRQPGLVSLLSAEPDLLGGQGAGRGRGRGWAASVRMEEEQSRQLRRARRRRQRRQRRTAPSRLPRPCLLPRTFSGTAETREMARPIVSARPTRPTLQRRQGEGGEAGGRGCDGRRTAWPGGCTGEDAQLSPTRRPLCTASHPPVDVVLWPVGQGHVDDVGQALGVGWGGVVEHWVGYYLTTLTTLKTLNPLIIL